MLPLYSPDTVSMNRSATAPPPAPLAAGPLVLAGLILLAALTRLLPHPPNFSPVTAIALFGGAHFASRRWALLVPLAGLLLSDVVLGLANGASYLDYLANPAYRPTLLAVYLAVVLSTLLGFGLRGRTSASRILGYSLAGSLLFFLLSNLATWLTAFTIPGYPACSTGLLPCYVAALPFFKWTLLGTLFYAALLFGGFALLRERLPALRLRTV